METSKQINNMINNNNNDNNNIINNNNMINNKTQQRSCNRSLLKHRNIHKNKRQSSISISKTTTSIVCVVLSLLQAPSGSHALIQSRTRPDMITRSHAGVSKTSLQYLNYRLNDDEGNPQPKATSSITDQQQQQQQQQQPPQKQQQLQQPQQHQISGLFHTLWTAGKTKRAEHLHALQVKREQKEQEEQYVIDAYLESIDRRYKRLHETDTQSSKKNPAGGFTNALQWLTHGSESWTDAEEQRKQEDGIYMLGLAGLASERLLQRHHLPIPELKVNKSMLTDLGIKKESIAFLTQPSTSEVSVPKSTATDASMSMGKATLIVQMIQSFKMRHLCKQIAMSYKKTNGLALNAVRMSGKALAHTLCALGAVLSNTSGSKQSFQIASAVAATTLTISLSVIRPLTKA